LGILQQFDVRKKEDGNVLEVAEKLNMANKPNEQRDEKQNYNSIYCACLQVTTRRAVKF